MILQYLAVVFISLALLPSCATKEKTTSSESELDSSSNEVDEAPEEDSSTTVSRSSRLFVQSVSNNNLTPYTVNKRDAADVAQDISSSLKKPSLKNIHKMIALMAMKRISGASYGSVSAVAKKVVSLEIEKSISRDIPPNAYLELALVTFQKKQYSMTEYYLEKLAKFKKPKLKAAALTIRGMIEQSDGRLPEAVDYWNKALKLVSSYVPARLNLGFYALKYGDFSTAKKYLSGMNDYYALTGYMQAVRQSSPANAQSLCRRILGKKKNYKPALFSCALNVAQGKGKLKKAKADLQKIAKTRGEPSEIDEKAYLVIGKIDRKLRKQEMEKRSKSKAKKTAAPEQAPAAPATK